MYKAIALEEVFFIFSSLKLFQKNVIQIGHSRKMLSARFFFTHTIILDVVVRCPLSSSSEYIYNKTEWVGELYLNSDQTDIACFHNGTIFLLYDPDGLRIEKKIEIEKSKTKTGTDYNCFCLTAMVVVVVVAVRAFGGVCCKIGGV